jgi:NADP-dependent 3-hydroxy acid dehydrogenase YdfG
MKPSDVASTALYIATQRDRVAVAELAFSMVSERY